MSGFAFISYGLGGTTFDPASGEAQLVARVKAIGIDTKASPYQWSEIQTIVDEVLALPMDAKIAIGGDSLGANEAPQIAQYLMGKRNIDYLFGFQRSQYGVQVAVPPNVRVADSIYNSVWLETLGLGDDPWTLSDGNQTTNLRNIPIRAAHPDDFGQAQDIVFEQIKRIVGA